MPQPTGYGRRVWIDGKWHALHRNDATGTWCDELFPEIKYDLYELDGTYTGSGIRAVGDGTPIVSSTASVQIVSDAALSHAVPVA